MEKLDLHGYTDGNGIFHIQNRKRLQEYAKQNPNKQFNVKIERRGAKRSLPQNSYYHAVVIQEIKLGFLNLGHEMNDDQVHYFLKEKFNPVPVENKDGVIIEMAGTTTQLTKTGFSEYIEKIARFAAEYLGVVIPAPNEHLEMKFE